MNYDDLSDPRKQFINYSLAYLDYPLRSELSDLFIESKTWQGFRILAFNYLDARVKELNIIRGQLVRL